MAAGIQRGAAHHRYEGVRVPLRWGHWLAIVVSVENYRASGARSSQISEDERWCADARGKLLRLETALLQQRLQSVRSCGELRGLCRDAPDTGEFVELADDLRFMSDPVALDVVAEIGR